MRRRDRAGRGSRDDAARVLRGDGTRTGDPRRPLAGGGLVLRPGRPAFRRRAGRSDLLQGRDGRNRLRVLEQQVNGSGLPADEGQAQGTSPPAMERHSFNVLFAEKGPIQGAGRGVGGIGNARDRSLGVDSERPVTTRITSRQTDDREGTSLTAPPHAGCRWDSSVVARPFLDGSQNASTTKDASIGSQIALSPFRGGAPGYGEEPP